VFRQVACELLERRGYTVVGEAGTAAAAREMVERLAPDGVLLDVRLPDANGLVLAAALVDAYGVAVVLTSADRVAPDAAVVRACGARGFVLKSRLVATDLAQFWPPG
jgi:DNA-binding NarL/FixJ family response regulator